MKAFRFQGPIRPTTAQKMPLTVLVIHAEPAYESHPTIPGAVTARLLAAAGGTVQRCGDAWHYGEGPTFSAAGDVWAWVEASTSRDRLAWVYCHDGPLVLTILDAWRLLPRRGWRCVFDVADEPPPLILHFAKGHKRFKLVDTCNYFPVPLTELPVSGWTVPNAPGSHADTPKVIRAVQGRLMAVGEALAALLGRWTAGGHGSWSPGVGGLAFASYRSQFIDEPISTHNCGPALQLERAAFYGGRSEAFWHGPITEPVFQVDVNGLFPHAMTRNDLPVALVSYDEPRRPADAALFAPGLTAIAEVDIETECEALPVKVTPAGRPVLEEAAAGRQEIGAAPPGRTVYAVGRFRTALAGAELRRAWANGYVTRVHRLAVYRTGKPLRSFVRYWWAEREAAAGPGAAAWRALAKGILLTCYGKWGQLTEARTPRPELAVEKPWGRWIGPAPDGKRYCLYHAASEDGYEISDGGEWCYSMPALAACITADARRYMDYIRGVAGPQSVYAQIIDSLILTEPGYGRLESAGMIRPGEIGHLRLVRSARDGAVWGPQDYEVGHIHKCSGMKRAAKPAGDHGYIQLEREALATIFGRGCLPYVTSEEITKVRQVQPPAGPKGEGGFYGPIRLG